MCAPRKKLIIELDGSQHLEQQEYDEERTKYLEVHGYRVLRFWNNDVMNDIDSVLQVSGMRFLINECVLKDMQLYPINGSLVSK